MMNFRFTLRTMLAIVAMGAIGFAAWGWLRPGVAVTVVNSGRSTMRDVELHVTGGTYPLGDIPAGEQRRSEVRPRGESSVEISLIEADGDRRRWDADCYFESAGYRGTLVVEYRDGEFTQRSNDIRLWP